MNKKGTRNTNGEGSIYTTIAKQKRKKFLDKECKICTECKHKCNRIEFEKCEKCKNCKTECLNYCDRYYCFERVQAQITLNGKQTTVANEKKKKDAVSKKIEAEAKALTNTYIKKNGVTLIELIKKVDDEKFKNGTISKNTKNRNKFIYSKIENSILNDIPIQNLTASSIQDFLNEHKYLSLSELDKLYDKIKQGFEQAIIKKIIPYADNPMNEVKKPISEKLVKKVEAFEIHEQIKLMSYVSSNNLSISNKCSYDSNTLKNLILLDLLTAMRIGEIGSIDYSTDINFNKNCFIVHSTLSRDDNNNIIKENRTKSGKFKIKKGEIDKREVPFDIFDKELVLKILDEQMEIAQKNPRNKNKLLFCRKDGNYLSHTSITNIFKRICREAHIKLDLITGCHIHMCRHTAITRMVESGMDLMVIAQIVGHSGIDQIVETYGHILNKFKNEQLMLSQQHYAQNNIFTLSIKNILSKKDA